MEIIAADKIFTGTQWIADHAVVIENGLIKDLLPRSHTRPTMSCPAGAFLCPAFIDLQIYGADNFLFAVNPTSEALTRLYRHCSGSGTAYCMPTVATNEKEIFYKCIDAIREYWKKGDTGILGLHLEGPWINPVKRGAHIESLIHSPDINEVDELLKYGKGVIKMITIAPEVCSQEVIDQILADDIIVSAGHSNATYQQATESFNNGVTAVTHLYNAMSGLQHRAPGLVGATFEHKHVMSSIIPDGHHVDYAAIRIAKKIMGERLFVITDAVTTTTEGYYQHYPAGDKYESAGILSGSALTMAKAAQNLVQHAGIELDEALRMCSLYPAKVLAKDNEWGRIEAGYKASMAILDENMVVYGVIKDAK